MNVNVGDKVSYLNDVGGGKVTKIIDRKTAMVMNEFGFEVPVSIKELVVIETAPSYEPQAKSDTTNQQVANEQEVVVDTNDIFYPEVTELEENGNDLNIHFAFVPQDRPGNSDLDIYLINDSNYNVFYSIINREDDGTTFSNAVGVIEANIKEQVETMALSSVNQIPEYIFHFVFYKKGNFMVKEPMVKSLKINPVKFYKERSYKVNDFFDEDAILFPLIGETAMDEAIKKLTKKDFNQVLTEKEKKEQKKTFVSPKEKEKQVMEVDLHIHELLDDFRGLTNGEIIEIQLDTFKSKLEEAKKAGVKKVVFIHGVGNGTLKLELRKALDKQKDKINYQDASFKEYGYGATMVQIKK